MIPPMPPRTLARLPTLIAIIAAWALALDPAAGAPSENDGRLPVVQKVQIIFSIVTHQAHLPNRVAFYNQNGGNTAFAVPHLVYDPQITLYNPYPEALTLDRVRVRIWDPPVGFRFKKNGVYLRPEFEQGEFLGLARFQIANERNPLARKSFTLNLTSATTQGNPGAPIVLAPGETEVFSPWVEDEWDWEFETRAGYTPHAFWDWDTSLDLTNRDRRASVPDGALGVSCVPQLSSRAGFQTDWLAASNRPAATLYPFEVEAPFASAGTVAMRLWRDTVTVETRAVDQVPDHNEPDFRLSVLAGASSSIAQDLCQDFSFRFDDLVQPRWDQHADPVVRRTFLAGNLFQPPNDSTPGGKAPFAVLTAVGRPELVTSGIFREEGQFEGSHYYDLRFDPTVGFSISQDFDLLEPLPPVSATKVLRTVRRDDEFRVALLGPTFGGSWRVMGGSDPTTFEDDLTGRSSILPGPDLYSHPLGPSPYR